MQKNNFSTQLDNHLNSVPHQHYNKTLRDLATYCGVTPVILKNWRTGKTYIKKGDRMLIEFYFEKKIFD